LADLGVPLLTQKFIRMGILSTFAAPSSPHIIRKKNYRTLLYE